MDKYTPETLRALADAKDYDGGGLPLKVRYSIDAHASAWDAECKRLEKAERQLAEAVRAIYDAWDILVEQKEIYYERHAINRLMDIRHQPWAIAALAQEK